MSTIFFTGFPGFLGSELLPRVLAREPEATAACLVQAKFADLARERSGELVQRDPSLAGRIEIVEGDITQSDLGLGAEYDDLAASTTEIYHLAAVYDLSVPRELAVKVNVDGTSNVCDFAEASHGLARLHYVSTCYVSGRHTGIFTEDDLVKGQQFNNFYEETKYLAEVEVQRRMEQGLPATIYRPAVVAGDSATGATQKFDGPYFVLRWLLKQPRIALMPLVGNPEHYTLNFVPRDFVVDAITHLSGLETTKGGVYALAHPNAPTVAELIRLMSDSTGRRIITIPLTQTIAKGALRRVPGLMRLMEMPADAVNYFTHPTHYLSRNTWSELEGTGIDLPAMPDYIARLTDFVRNNPDTPSVAMV